MHFVDQHVEIRKLRWYDKTPLVNTIVDSFFDVAPTPEQLQETLNLIGLMAALLLSVMLMLPFSYTPAEYMEAIEIINYTPFDENGKILNNTRGQCEPEGGFAYPFACHIFLEHCYRATFHTCRSLHCCI